MNVKTDVYHDRNLNFFFPFSNSGSAMNVVYTEKEMKKFLAEAARVSQVLYAVLSLASD